MNLQTLRYVVTIEQTGSFSKASQYLYVSQTTLSRAVKELEEQQAAYAARIQEISAALGNAL